MNAKWKITLYLVITLIIGIVIGAMLNRALVQKRIKNIFKTEIGSLLIRDAERVLAPMSPAQKELIRQILDKHAEKLSEIHERFGNEIQAAFKSLREEIDPLLTAEQKKQLEGMFPGPPPFRRHPPEGFPFMKKPFSPESELAMLQSELNLSEEQVAKIKAILEEFQAQEKPFREKGAPPETFDSFRQANEKKFQEIEKILTEDQKEKFRRLRKPGPDRREDWR
jgi:hypothetical protein